MENKSAILKYREKHNLTLDEFGKKFTPDVTASTVSRWEQGLLYFHPKRLDELKAITGITPQMLYSK